MAQRLLMPRRSRAGRARAAGRRRPSRASRGRRASPRPAPPAPRRRAPPPRSRVTSRPSGPAPARSPVQQACATLAGSSRAAQPLEAEPLAPEASRPARRQEPPRGLLGAAAERAHPRPRLPARASARRSAPPAGRARRRTGRAAAASARCSRSSRRWRCCGEDVRWGRRARPAAPGARAAGVPAACASRPVRRARSAARRRQQLVAHRRHQLRRRAWASPRARRRPGRPPRRRPRARPRSPPAPGRRRCTRASRSSSNAERSSREPPPRVTTTTSHPGVGERAHRRDRPWPRRPPPARGRAPRAPACPGSARAATRRKSRSAAPVGLVATPTRRGRKGSGRLRAGSSSPSAWSRSLSCCRSERLGPGPARLELLHHELVLAVRRVDLDEAPGHDLQPRPRSVEGGPCAPARPTATAPMRGLRVLQREVDVPARLAAQVRHLPGHPDVAEARLDRARRSAGQLAHPEGRALPDLGEEIARLTAHGSDPFT